MKEYNYELDVVDFAYQIIGLHKENERLHRELEHYEKIFKLNCDTIKKQDKHSGKIQATLLSAVFDPDSVINKGHRAIIKEQLKGE